jgi:hypothetical protein
LQEPLLARLILQSIKASLEYERLNGKNIEGEAEKSDGLDQSENLISSVHPLGSESSSSALGGGGDNNPNISDQNEKKKSHQDSDGSTERRIMSFQFLVFQYDKDR